MIEKHSALWQLANEETGVTLAPEDHAALHQYFQLSSTMQTFEEEYYFFAGQMMALSYGFMLERLKKDILETDDSTSSHLIDLLAIVRTDEVEEQLQDENAEYRERIKEEKHCEEELQKLNLSRAERKAICDCHQQSLDFLRRSALQSRNGGCIELNRKQVKITINNIKQQ